MLVKENLIVCEVDLVVSVDGSCIVDMFEYQVHFI